MPGVLIGLNKADMFVVFIGSFVCKIHFEGHSTSFNPTAKVVWAGLFLTRAHSCSWSGTFEDPGGFRCQKLVLLFYSAPHPPTPQTSYHGREGQWGFR